MIRIKDKYGNIVFEVDEVLFPLKVHLSTVWGEKNYILRITYVKDKETHIKDLTKISGLMLN